MAAQYPLYIDANGDFCQILSSDVVNTSALGTGTASSTTVLRGDSSWISSSVTIGSTAVALGATVSTLAGLTSLTTYNLYATGTSTTNLTASNDISVNQIMIGCGGYAVPSNIAIGQQALLGNTASANNIAIGYGSLSTSSVGSHNQALGYQAQQVATGSYNSAIGDFALSGVTGNNNVALGYYAGVNAGAGAGNVYVGVRSGYTATGANGNVSGNNNTWVGYNSGPGTTTQLSNSTAIGYGALNLNSNEIVLGNASVTSVTTSGALTLGSALTIPNGGTGQTTASAALNALLPSQSGANGLVLQSDGTRTSWQVAGSGSGPSLGLVLATALNLNLP